MAARKAHRSAQGQKRKVLTRADPSQAAEIGAAVTIKHGDLYLLTRNDGTIPDEPGHGLGLYCRDCRFVSGYGLTLERKQLESLGSNSQDGFQAVFQLTNPSLDLGRGSLPKQRIGITMRHVLDDREPALRDELILENYDREAHQLRLALRWQADFQDVFVIRGLIQSQGGRGHRPKRVRGELRFSRTGADRIRRELRVNLSRRPSRWHARGVDYNIRLHPHQPERLVITFRPVEGSRPGAGRPRRDTHARIEHIERVSRRSVVHWMAGFPVVRSSHPWINRVIGRSLHDLRTLRMKLEGHRFFAAGIPWFATLFGRDSIVAALQLMAYRAETAAETLRLLANFQGDRVDQWREEEPGKILHELRRGELANLGVIPHTPYYGTVDATPLFIILCGEYLRWTGDRDLIRSLLPHIEAALGWMRDWGDSDGDGFLDYGRAGEDPVVHEGWKDSGNAIVDSAGRPVGAPVALVEVQGYAFRALQEAATLMDVLGRASRATELRQEAGALQRRFERTFWSPEQDFYALALHDGGNISRVVSSNPGQALWTGIIPPRRRAAVARRLMLPDLYSGWGIRTLSADQPGYNPVSYHRGTVWPHDNALIGAGLVRSGKPDQACRIFEDLLDAATWFGDFRLPELFAGYDREEAGKPVHYPVACHPQAWAAGAMPYLLAALLGLEPDGVKHRLTITQPHLPDSVRWLEFHRLRVGEGTVDLRFQRDRSGELRTEVTRVKGSLEVTTA